MAAFAGGASVAIIGLAAFAAAPAMLRLDSPMADVLHEARLPSSWVPPATAGRLTEPLVTGAVAPPAPLRASGQDATALASAGRTAEILSITSASLPTALIPPRNDAIALTPSPLLPVVARQPEAPSEIRAGSADPDELITFGSRQAPRRLVDTILRAAAVTGVDPVYLMTLADVESSLSPQAKAPTSSAEGLFQFIDATWLEMLHLHGAAHGFEAAAQAIQIVNEEPVVTDGSKRAWLLGLKRNPYLSAVMAGELIKDMQAVLHRQGERELSEAELYLAHFLGPKGVVRFLESLDEAPDMTAAKLLPKAARANQGLFTERQGRKRRSITVAELYARIDAKIIKRLDRYHSLSRLSPRLVAGAGTL